MNDKRDELYKNLIGSGKVTEAEIGTIDEFKAAITDEESARVFHKNLMGSGIFSADEIGSEDDFYGSIGSDFASAEPEQRKNGERRPGFMGQRRTAPWRETSEMPEEVAQRKVAEQPAENGSEPVQAASIGPLGPDRFGRAMEIGKTVSDATRNAMERMEAIRKGNAPFSGGRERRYNPATKQFENVYYTPTGEVVGSETEQQRARMSVNEAFGQTELGEAYREAQMKADKRDRAWGERHARMRGYDKDFGAASEAAWEMAGRNTTAAQSRTAQSAAFAFGDPLSNAVLLKADQMSNYDLAKMSEDAWVNLGKDKQEAIISDYIGMLKDRYSDGDGEGTPMSAEEAERILREQAEKMARAASDQKMYEVALAKNAPENVVDFFLRKTVGANMITKLVEAAARATAGSSSAIEMRDMATQRYEEDGHRVAGLAGTVVGMGLDPTTWAAGAVGGAAVKGAIWLGGRFAGDIAVRKFGTTLAGRVLSGVVGGAGNFGTFESGNEMLEQMRIGGHRNEETGEIEDYDFGAVAGKFGHGVLMGAASGAVAPLLGNVSDKLVRATSSTMGKMGIRAGQLGVSTLAEGTIFSIPEWIEGDRDAMDVWTDNLAMMLAFKGQHVAKSGARAISNMMSCNQRIAELRGLPRREVLRGWETRLREALDGAEGMSLTREEADELERAGYGDLNQLVEDYNQYIKGGDTDKGRIDAERLLTGRNGNIPYNRFEMLMNDGGVSEAARAKMYYYLTGKTLPMSTVMGSSVIEYKDDEGNVTGYTVRSIGANGIITSRNFSGKDRADIEIEKINRQAELNSIDIGERYYDRKSDQKRMYEACEAVARERGVPARSLYDMMQKGIEGMSAVELEWAEEVARSYDKIRADKYASNGIRNDINEEYGVDIDAVIKKEPNRRDKAEQEALDEYMKRLWVDVEREGRGEGVEYERGYNANDEGRNDIMMELAMSEDNADTQEAYEGMVQRVNDDADMMVAERREAMRPAMQADGTLHPAVLKEKDSNGNDKTIYIISGNVVMSADGATVDPEASDRSIVIYDPSTGERRMIDPAGDMGILSVGEVTTVEDFEARLEREKQAFVQAEIEAASGKVTIEPGYTFNMEDGGQAVVTEVNGDAVVYATEDGQIGETTVSVVQAIADAMRLADYRERHPEAEQQAQAGRNAESQEATEAQREEATAPADESAEAATAPAAGDEPMPMREDGEPDFMATTSERGHRYIYDEAGLSQEEAGKFVKANIDAAEKELKKLEGKAPKMGTSLTKYQQDKAAHQQQVEQAQAVLDYWNGVRAEQQRIVAAERAEQAERDRAAHEAAVLAEEQRQAEELAKQQEQAARGSNTVAPHITEKWNASPKVEGVENEITLANGETVKGRYMLVESGAATPSHNPNMEFARNEGFPVDENGQTVNDRDYERDQQAQQITRDMADRYDSRALQNVPVVSRDGVVLSGNGRTMAGELAAQQGTDGAYIEHLKKYPQQFGFTAEQVEAFINGVNGHPRVVFVPEVDMPYTTETFAKFNAQDMKSQSRTEQSVKLGKTVDDATFGRIVRSINAFDTLGDFYNDPKAAPTAIGELHKAGVINQMQVAEMMDGEKVSGQGRQMLENMLIGKAFESNPDAIRQLSEYPAMRQSVVSALAEIANNIHLGEDYSLEGELAQAIDLAYQARKSGIGAGEKVSGFARQQSLFPFETGETVADYTNASVLMLADCLNDGRVSQLKKVLALYNDHAAQSAAGQYDIFSGGVKSKEEILKEVLNILNYGTETEQQTALAGAAERRKEAAGAGQDGAAGSSDAGSGAAAAGQSDLAQAEGLNYQLSDEVDENGRQFVLTNSGELEFGVIGEDTGLTAAPILLSEGIITNPATNDGYGLVHIEARHGDEIRRAGYASVIDFIEEVAKNYEVIREGKNRDGIQTYMLQLTDKHNNTLMVELSGDGTYWNINTAGIFKTSYGAKRDVVYNRHTTDNQPAETDVASLSGEPGGTTPSTSMNATAQQKEVYTRPAVEPGTDTDSSEVNRGQNEGATATSRNSSLTSDGKDTNNSETEQEKVVSAIKSAEAEVDTNPTEGQKKAGNYKMGHVTVDGYDITIEQPKGSIRRGTDDNGKQWEQEMHNTYGYIRGTEGVDGDHIDVFLSDDPTSGDVFVVDQVDQMGIFDEHKVMYGFPDIESARQAYLSNYEDGWQGLGAITPVSKEAFKKWIESSKRKIKPFSKYRSVETLGEVQVENGVNGFDGLNRPTMEKREAERIVADIVSQLDDHPSEKNDALIQSIADMEYEAEQRLEDSNLTYDERAQFQAQYDAASKWLDDNVRSQKGVDDKGVDEVQKALRDGLVELMRSAGLDVVSDEKEGQRVLDKFRELARLMGGPKRKTTSDTRKLNSPEGEKAYVTVISDAESGAKVRKNLDNSENGNKKTALQAASVTENQQHHPAVTSSADGAKIQKKLDRLAEKYEKVSNRRKNFIDEVAEVLNAKRYGSDSRYATFETDSGNIVTVRLSNHNATVENFDYSGRYNGISVVITSGKNNGMNVGEGKAHIVEFYYNEMKLRKAFGKPLADIVRSIKEALSTGEYVDPTGLAEREEVNADTLREMRAYHGSGADFDAFDHSHMGEGEGAQAYGWGTYVTEVEGIGKAYAKRYGTKYQYDEEFYSFRKRYSDVLKNTFSVYETDTIDDLRASIKSYERDRDERDDWNIPGYEEEWHYFDEIVKEGKAILKEWEKFEHFIPDRILYTVDIPDDNGSNYLGWDKPIGEENIGSLLAELEKHLLTNDDYYKEQYKGHENDLIANLKADFKSTDEGRFVYKNLAGRLGSDKAASEFLHSMGYVGIKYPAEYMSGGRSDGAKNYVVFDEGDLKITDKARLFRTEEGEVWGYTIGGKIYIDPSVATAETPIHEYTHLWTEALRKANPQAWGRLKEEMRQQEGLMDYVRSKYPELTNEDELMDEVFAHYSGRRGAERLESDMREAMAQEPDLTLKAQVALVFHKLREMLQKFWTMARDLFAGKVKGLEKLTAEDFADMALDDLLRGFDPNGKRKAESGKRDADYLAAVQRSDMETAQQMVNEAAREAMPDTKIVDENGTPRVVYHQTANVFTVFNPRHHGAGTNDNQMPFGVYLKPTDSNIGVQGERQMALFADIKNPLHFADRTALSSWLVDNVPGYREAKAEYERIDREYDNRFEALYSADGEKYDDLWERWHNGEISEEEYQRAIDEVDSTQPLLDEWHEAENRQSAVMKNLVDDYMRASEYDGIVIDNDEGSFGRTASTILALNPAQVKSADAVTYDAEGRVIPLSKRFDKRNADIRYEKGDNRMSMEQISEFVMKAAAKNKSDAKARNYAMRVIGANLDMLCKAMGLQKEFDRDTVKRVTSLAKAMLGNGYLDGLRSNEVSRLLSAVERSTGKDNINEELYKVMDIMIDNQLRHAEEALHKLESVRGSRVDAKGVEVQGQLDVAGQRMVETFKKARQMQRKDVEERMAEAENRMGSDDEIVANEAAQEHAGMQMALNYIDNIQASETSEEELQREIREEERKIYRYDQEPVLDEDGKPMMKKDGTPMMRTVRHVKPEYKDTKDNPISEEKKREREQVRQTVKAIEEAIRKEKTDRLRAYMELVGNLGGTMKESMARAKERREAEKERVAEIQHNANSDMEGRPSNEHHADTETFLKRVNNLAANTIFAPLGTFTEMLRLFGSKSAGGEGYLFNRFVRGLIDARQKEIRGVRGKYAILDAKAREVFGEGVKNWADVMNEAAKGDKISVDFWDGGKMQPHKLHQGNLMYIYMVDKMSDGRMKLRKMGVSEEAVEAIAKKLDPRLKELADWLQEEFLVDTRKEYNETHKRMFGASMAEVENYFPLKILANARLEKPEDLDAPERNEGISTRTGSIIKRTANTLALDLMGADALHVILDHVAQMEHWNAFAEYNRDLNTLRTYKRFRNQVQNMTTIYGNGEKLWKKFNEVCQMATGAYHPKQHDFDKGALEFAQGVTAAKVSFRVNTALKQLLSLPAYLPYVNAKGFYRSVANNIKGKETSFQWCLEHLPMFEERWKSKVSGDPRLAKTAMDWQSSRANFVQRVSRAGMLPNAFIDALTVSIGAHAVYETRLNEYLKAGYQREAAEKRAIQDAEIAYNETQQSSEGGFLSTMQSDRTWLSVMFTVFRNSSMAYQRQLHGALRNLGHNLTKAQRAATLAFETKQMVRDGVPEERAEAAAKSRRGREMRKNALAVATFGYIVQFAWNLGGKMWYLIFGDDDDEKEEMWDDIWAQSMFGGVEGLTGGDVMSEFGRQIVRGDYTPRSLDKDMPLSSDLARMMQKFGQGKGGEALNDMVNLLVQAGIGVNPQSLTDAVLATVDLCGGDLELSHEALLFATRVLQVPQSQIKKLYFDEIGMSGEEAQKMSVEELVERYARYQVKRGRLATPWEWDDEELLKKERDKGMKAVRERMEHMDTEELLNMRYGGKGMKDEVKKELKKRLENEPPGSDEVNEAYERYEAQFNELDKRVKEARELRRNDPQSADLMIEDIRNDEHDYKVYTWWKPMDEMYDAMAKELIKAKSIGEYDRNMDILSDYREKMVTMLDEEDEAKASSMRMDLINMYLDFMSHYKEKPKHYNPKSLR